MGLIQNRMNEHAHDCEVAYRLLERAPADDGGLVAEGKVFAATLRAGGDPPSLDELRWWHRRARMCIKALKETDPEAVLAYMKGLESEKDQRLIRGM